MLTRAPAREAPTDLFAVATQPCCCEVAAPTWYRRVAPETVPVFSGAVNFTTKCVRRCPEAGLTLIRALLALIAPPGGAGLAVDEFELVCELVDPAVLVEELEPALDAAEHAGRAAIPSTTSEATTFGLIHGRVYPWPQKPFARYS